MSNPRQSGAAAARDGRPVTSNPYNVDSEQGREWAAGWQKGYTMWVLPRKTNDERKGRHRPKYPQ